MALEAGESGDLHVVAPFDYGALLATIDGLGHGPEAALAARRAAEILRAHAALPVKELIERCHEGLRKTRGAVMSVASLDTRSSTIDWCGVGNVECVLLSADQGASPSCQALSTRGGVVGYRLPPLKSSTISVSAGDVLIFATDGIRSGFVDSIDVEREVQVTADAVLAQWTRGSDDALVFVARYLGHGS